MKSLSVRRLAFSAVLAAVYAALTMSLGFMSYGNVQLRIAEALCVLPFFFPTATWGLFIGCVIANLLSPMGIADVVFGSLATLLSCLCTALIGAAGRATWPRCIAACLMPVVWNAVIIGAMLAVLAAPLSVFVMMPMFGVYALQVAAGEAVVMLGIGLPLMRILPGKKYFLELMGKLGK